jgi:two-component system nitrate/nitrite response regulator NarL
MVTILIVDSRTLMRRAVREVVEQEGDLTVIAEACNGFEAEARAAETQPDVILMDLDMPGCDGFEATERVLTCSPQSRVVIFSSSYEERLVFQAIQKGAIGYITKDTEPEALIHALRCAARSDLCIPGPLAAQVAAHLRMLWQSYEALSLSSRTLNGSISFRVPRRLRRAASQASEPPATPTPGAPRPLTGREHEILALIRKGRKNREIARELSIAESTVHKHIQNIFEKLHARNRAEAIYLTSIESEPRPKMIQ